MASNFCLETQHVVVAAGPDQPQLFNFPKRSFESKKVVKRTFQPSWWPFLHYDESTDAVFCPTCLMAFKLKRMKTSMRADSAFVSSVSMLLSSTTYC